MAAASWEEAGRCLIAPAGIALQDSLESREFILLSAELLLPSPFPPLLPKAGAGWCSALLQGVGNLSLGEDGAEDNSSGMGEKWIFPAPLWSFLHMDTPRDTEREIQEMSRAGKGWESGVHPL